MSLHKIGRKISKLIDSKKTPIGLYRFATRLQLLLPHVEDAAEGFEETQLESPAKRFYESRTEKTKARDALFHLEALTRIYEKTHKDDADTFDELSTIFKELEDGLGRIDYFDAFHKEEIPKLSGVPEKIIGYFVGGYHVELQNLTKRMRDSGWLVKENEEEVSSPALEKILDMLDDVDWSKDRKDRKGIIEFFIDAVEKVLEKGGAGEEDGLDFEDLENGVHEFRRTVRWLNIYPQGLGGLCQLVGDDSSELDSSLSEYHTQSIRESSFLRYPLDEREEHRIEIEASLMFAFSYVIDKIGDIKDEGQLAEALEHALLRTGEATADDVHDKVHALTPGHGRLEDIPGKTIEIVNRFIHTNRVPQQMIESFKAQLD